MQMKSKSLKCLQKFVYIDSSEEDEPFQKNGNESLKCKINNKNSKSRGAYQKQLKEVLQRGIQQIEGGNALLVQVSDKGIEQNLCLRKQKYKYFLKQIEIDAKYDGIMKEKIQQVKSKNKKKQQILKQKRLKDSHKDQENLLKKYIVQKQSQEEKVVKGLKNTVHKLGVERNTQIIKHIKTQIEIEKDATNHKLEDLRKRQQNEMQELRQKYEAIKTEKRINKLDQAKIINSLEQQNQKQKQTLKQKLLLKKQFVI